MKTNTSLPSWTSFLPTRFVCPFLHHSACQSDLPPAYRTLIRVLYPQGHALVISKFPYPDIFDIPEDVLSAVAVASKKVAVAVKKAVSADGVNILQNNRSAAGQEVVHYHVHVIPRFDNDGIKLGFKPGKIGEDEAKELLESIKAAL